MPGKYLCLMIGLIAAFTQWGFAQGSAFTYQGRLTEGGLSASGVYDMEFTLYDAAVDGAAVADAVIDPNVVVSNGLFAVRLDFGGGPFDGSARWLQIAVRTNGATTTRFQLLPRQALTPAPYAITAGSVTGPITGGQIAAGTIGSAHLAPGAASGNLFGSGQSAVGSGGVVLSELIEAPGLVQAGYTRIGQVELAGEAWIPRAGPPPSARTDFTAVWTGSEYIIWGGSSLNTGGRYSPTLNRWIPVSTVNAPQGRTAHTAVWTGKEMIIWGGSAGYSNTGGRYNPATDIWAATSLVNAPTGRDSHCAVWTGKEMIVFGGFAAGTPGLTTGGRYNPDTDTWVAIVPNALGTSDPRAIWTGTEMVVSGFNSSARVYRYHPTSGSWNVSSSAEPFVFLGRDHKPVWTGTEIIYWKNPTESRRYFPGSDTWGVVSSSGAPAEWSQSVAWNGKEMIVWGGTAARSGRYNPNAFLSEWSSMSTNEGIFPTGPVVWTGAQMLAWGGGAVGRYDPTANAWTPSTPFVPGPRQGHVSVWTGDELVVWGGVDSGYLDTGGRYHAARDAWMPTSAVNVPVGRRDMAAVWTGSEMIVWGGYGGIWLQSGGRYRPASDEWWPTSLADAPIARAGHTAVWTGAEMIIWGGNTNQFTSQRVNTGGRYDPLSDTWTAISTVDAPEARAGHTAVWTGSEMIIWGGQPLIGSLNTGGRYSPATDSWQATSTVNAPEARLGHSAIWTGTEMIIWGGNRGAALSSGGRYDPVTDTWRPTSLVNAPAGRQRHTAIWNRKELIVWGGYDSNVQMLDSGGRYDPVADVWSSLTLAGAPAGRYLHTAEWTGSELIIFGGYNSVQNFNTTHSYLPPKRMSLYLKP